MSTRNWALLGATFVSVIYGFFALNAVSAFFIAVGIFSYVVIYTVWLKRKNTSNIVIGGIAGSAAAWAGWSAATGSMDLLGFLVGFLVFVWTPSHFWCLAMKMKDQYAQAEVPMLPVVINAKSSNLFVNKSDAPFATISQLKSSCISFASTKANDLYFL